MVCTVPKRAQSLSRSSVVFFWIFGNGATQKFVIIHIQESVDESRIFLVSIN